MRGYGRGIATISTRHDVVLDVWFPDLSLAGPPRSPLALAREGDTERAVRFEPVEAAIDLDAAPGGAADAYLRLHLLSARLVQPHGLSVAGIFRSRRRLAGQPLTVHAIDKFPRMTDFVSPPGVRIADTSRVRLGAYLAEGTVVMHEGLVNFNAGTLGACMVEGRITQGSVVDAGADIGAGLYITRGTLVTLPDGRIVKAAELSGTAGILFRRHSVSGTVEAVPWRSSSFTGLNDALHA